MSGTSASAGTEKRYMNQFAALGSDDESDATGLSIHSGAESGAESVAGSIASAESESEPERIFGDGLTVQDLCNAEGHRVGSMSPFANLIISISDDSDTLPGDLSEILKTFIGSTTTIGLASFYQLVCMFGVSLDAFLVLVSKKGGMPGYLLERMFKSVVGGPSMQTLWASALSETDNEETALAVLSKRSLLTLFSELPGVADGHLAHMCENPPTNPVPARTLTAKDAASGDKWAGSRVEHLTIGKVKDLAYLLMPVVFAMTNRLEFGIKGTGSHKERDETFDADTPFGGKKLTAMRVIKRRLEEIIAAYQECTTTFRKKAVATDADGTSFKPTSSGIIRALHKNFGNGGVLPPRHRHQRHSNTAGSKGKTSGAAAKKPAGRHHVKKPSPPSAVDRAKATAAVASGRAPKPAAIKPVAPTGAWAAAVKKTAAPKTAAPKPVAPKTAAPKTAAPTSWRICFTLNGENRDLVMPTEAEAKSAAATLAAAPGVKVVNVTAIAQG